MNVQSILSGVFIRYGLAQATLLPLMLFSWLIIPKRASLRFQWVFHRALMVAAIALPILLSLPGASSIAHAIGDQAVGAPAAEQAMVARAPVPPDPTTPYYPPLPAPDPKPVEKAPTAAVPVAGSPIFTFTEILGRLPTGLGTFSLLGLLGFLVIIGRQVARERRIRATVSGNERIGKISVIASDLVRSPFSTGLLRPRIYLPTAFARSSIRRRMVLAHEVLHVRKLHIAWTFIERLHAALFWYNPLAHLIATNGSRLRELLCDRGAGRIHGEVAYCRVLLDAAESLDATRASPGLANAWMGRRFLRRRIEFIALRLGMTSRRWVFAAAPITALVSLVVFMGCGPRVLPEPASGKPTAAAASTPSVTTLTQKNGEWPDSTNPMGDRSGFVHLDVVVDAAVTGWNMGTGRMHNFWTDYERKLVLGVDNPEGFWFTTTEGTGIEAAAFNKDIHAVISGLLVHLPFLQRAWAGLRSSDPTLGGDTGISISIDTHGRVISATPDPAKPSNVKLAKTYAAAISGWQLTARDLTSGYLVRIPITSFLRQEPPNDYRIMSVRLGDPVAEVPSSMLTRVDAATLGGQQLQDDWYGANGLDPNSVGSVLVAVNIAPDGSIQDSRVLDSDLPDASRAADIVTRVKTGPRFRPVPSGRQIALVLMFANVPVITDSGSRGGEYRREAYAIGSDAVQYVDSLKGGVAGRVKLELPPGGFTSIVRHYPAYKSITGMSGTYTLEESGSRE